MDQIVPETKNVSCLEPIFLDAWSWKFESRHHSPGVHADAFLSEYRLKQVEIVCQSFFTSSLCAVVTQGLKTINFLQLPQPLFLKQSKPIRTAWTS